MATQTNRAIQACVAYYHICTHTDDWGTMSEDWVEVLVESPAPGYTNRYFQRSGEVFHERDNSKGVMVVTFLNDEITETEWYVRPSGAHAVEGENYISGRTVLPTSVEPETPKPEGYGVWA